MTQENPDSLRSTLKSINAAYESIRQARLDAGVAPGEPLLWPTPADHPDFDERCRVCGALACMSVERPGGGERWYCIKHGMTHPELQKSLEPVRRRRWWRP